MSRAQGTETIDPCDLALMSLLDDLRQLDAIDPREDGRRSRLVRSALQAVEVLEEAGGGALGTERIARLKGALLFERGSA